MSTLVVCGGLAWSSLSLRAQEESKDDYQVYIQKENPGTPNFVYAFRKTNITGGTVLPEESGEGFVVTFDPSKNLVSPADFPALERSKKLSERATQYTRLFVSTSSAALGAVLRNQATSKEKKLVASESLPQKKMGTYCIGKLTCIVGGTKERLAIKFDDKRECMRSGSKEGQRTKLLIRQQKDLERKVRGSERLLDESLLAAESQIESSQMEGRKARLAAQKAETEAKKARRALSDAKDAQKVAEYKQKQAEKAESAAKDALDHAMRKVREAESATDAEKMRAQEQLAQAQTQLASARSELNRERQVVQKLKASNRQALAQAQDLRQQAEEGERTAREEAIAAREQTGHYAQELHEERTKGLVDKTKELATKKWNALKQRFE